MMKHQNQSISFLAGKHIAQLFPRQLPSDLLFHNFHHTVNVVRGVRNIGNNMHLDNEQKEILLLAAWFHDSGHVITYQGHEAESQKLAKAFLESHHYPAEKTEQVLGCIGATRMPQKPQNLLQQVICDADLFHLSLHEYLIYNTSCGRSGAVCSTKNIQMKSGCRKTLIFWKTTAISPVMEERS